MTHDMEWLLRSCNINPNFFTIYRRKYSYKLNKIASGICWNKKEAVYDNELISDLLPETRVNVPFFLASCQEQNFTGPFMWQCCHLAAY